MIALTLGEIAAIVSGSIEQLDPDVRVTGKAEFDSRRVEPGDLFVAFEGEARDGHDFADAALAAGAVAALTTRSIPAGSIVVADPIEAISALASHVSRRLGATIIGITGSSGKTSTKDLLAHLLGAHGRTVASPGSFNNELGFPYTVLLADERTEFLILETSARAIGDIAHLTDIAPPRIGAVLNVGSAHLGEFGSVATIAQAKGELIEALPPEHSGGIAVLNADDPLVLAMAARTKARVLRVGEHRNADVRAENISLDERGRPRFDLVTAAGRAPVQLQLVGWHHVANALSAAGIALNCGMPLAAVATGLSTALPRSRWRMEVTETADGILVINDAYNANPDSMRAALKALATMSHNRRSIAVLGYMAELGHQSTAEHDEIGRLAARYEIDQLIAVGDQARPIAHGAALEESWHGAATWVPDTDDAVARLAEVLEPGDVLLVKGSRAAGMERVAEAIIAARGVSE